MKPSRLVAGMIAATRGVGLGVVFIVWQGDRAFAGNMGALKIDLAVAFGVSYGLFWVADRLGLIADAFTKDSEISDVYPEKPKDEHQPS